MSIKKALEISKRLSSVKRFSQSHLAKPENVMEHTGEICFFSYCIGHAINSITKDNTVDMGILMSKAVVHDIDECFTGDIAMPMKYASTQIRNSLAVVEEAYVKEISKDGLIELNHWKDAKKGVEGSIVAFCDVVCAISKFHNEIVVLSNGSMRLLLESKNNVINRAQDKVDEISSLTKDCQNHGEIEVYLFELAQEIIEIIEEIYIEN
jgi:5'-deoxynucleotidase YfbR-like HD superfamily hydrolase